MKYCSVDWDIIKVEYLSQKFSKKQLCEKYGINLSQLKYRILKYDWDNLKKTSKKKIVKNIKFESKSQEFDYNQAHLKMYEDCAKIIRALMNLYLTSNIEPDAGELQKIVAAIEKIQKGQRVSLGLDKDTGEVCLPTINIVENLNRNKL